MVLDYYVDRFREIRAERAERLEQFHRTDRRKGALNRKAIEKARKRHATHGGE